MRKPRRSHAEPSSAQPASDAAFPSRPRIAKALERQDAHGLSAGVHHKGNAGILFERHEHHAQRITGKVLLAFSKFKFRNFAELDGPCVVVKALQGNEPHGIRHGLSLPTNRF